MNAGNMGLPLALFAFGEPGLQRATIFYVIMSTLQHSLGIYILSGDRGWKEIFPRMAVVRCGAVWQLNNPASSSPP